jgi:hypothetical protein
VKYLKTFEASEQWQIHQTLIQRNISPKLRSYLGKGIM